MRTMGQTAASILVRSKMSADEWTRFRVLALRQNEPTSEIVGRLMREYLELNDPAGVVTKRRRNA